MKATTLPSLKLIALDISELHNHRKEIDVYSLRGGLEGEKKKKKPVWSDLEAEKLVELYQLKLSKKETKKTHFRMSYEAWPFPG